MSDQPMTGDMSGGTTSDDKLWSALAYWLPLLGPALNYFQESKKARPFIRSHNAQALALGIVFWVSTALISGLVGCCTTPVIGIYLIYCGYQAYQGKNVNIPVVSDFVKNQGWA